MHGTGEGLTDAPLDDRLDRGLLTTASPVMQKSSEVER